ncbi:NERD domain-containing protein [Pseudomonas aeruginosa]|uniref:NERD domain-containing protein n=1 Tax=Pseudomonas aeruginosa TaxID=287 RepID=UPI002236FAD3|nr:NERD domain-containing protein [Pseudomonas aeruginosa]
MTERGKRCRQHYQSVYERNQPALSKGRALDESLHHFLDQRPAGKKLSALDRATGLASAPFWHDAEAVARSELASLALSRVLHFDNAVSAELLLELASHAPDTLRWAIRYSKLFERTASPLWLALRAALVGGEWQVFFGVCDRLLDQLKPFDELIGNAEKQLEHLSLLELIAYLSVLAYQAFAEDAPDDRSGQQWQVYNRIILRKLRACPEQDFRLNESRLGQSLKRHLSPVIFPESSTADAARCRENLEWLAVLIAATQERIDYEGSIDWFCFDPECRYQLKPGELVIYNQSEAGTERWQRTGRKSDLLWHYWMSRAVQAFVNSGLAEQMIGSPENHELNQLAYIKAMRSELQLQQIYGLGHRRSLSNGTQVQLHHVLLASELTSVFFQSQFIQPFQDYLRESGVLAHALGRLNARRADVQAETQRVELALAESLRQRGFAVEVGYRPPVTEEDDAGEVDLICQRDGVLLLMEVKSGYIRSTTHEVWLHRTNTLRKAAWQLRRKRTAVARALVADQDLRFRLGYSGQCTETDLRAWIVDTSIELDGQSVDGFRVLSREALEVVLRDEKQLLRPVDQFDDEQGRCSLFPDGFTAGRFIAVVESDELWRGIC